MLIDGPLLEGKLIRRYKRFLMDIELPDGAVQTVHCPNSGSMEGCLPEGAPVLASLGKGKARKLSHTAELIGISRGWIGINTHRTNRIVEEALRKQKVGELAEYESVRPEFKISDASRIDFLLTGQGLPDCYVEVKNTTMPTADGAIAFPDAVTTRGQKHLKELMAAAHSGIRTVMLYVINRPDGRFFRPSWEKDPAYCELLEKAAKAGVEILAYRTKIDPPKISLLRQIPIKISCRA